MQTLEDYKISPVTGCLLRQPPTPPSSLLPYKKLLERSYSLLKTGELRAAVQELPTLDTSQFKTHEEKRLGHKILALLSAQYVWQDGDRNPAEILPAVIAMPLMQLSIELGCQPLLGHIDLVLSNCYPEKTQLGQRQSFFTEAFPSNEMNWVPFIERTADIELMFSDAAKIIMHIISSIRRNNVPMIVQCLDELGDVISIMREMLLLLLKELDPKAFYCDMRPFLSGWSHGQVSKGLVYEGVPDSVLTGAEEGCLEGNTLPKKRVYLGASAGQSIILQAFDALLGITHYDDTDKFFTTARNYMIKEHRRFIEDLQRHVKLREFGNDVVLVNY
uniref:Indoleamine 2,3-dioxygenase 2 n=1 Tax=Mesocestoides corti TaxID=53468 RepID=A0A5K3FD95_MESCO